MTPPSAKQFPIEEFSGIGSALGIDSNSKAKIEPISIGGELFFFDYGVTVMW